MLFISYARNDKAIVQPLARLLRAAGQEVFLDLENLDYGADWKAGLARAIQNSSRFLLFWSESSAHSPFVEEEWRQAVASQKIAIVPIMLDTTPLPKELASLHGTNDLQPIANRVLFLTRATRWITSILGLAIFGIGAYALYVYQISPRSEPDIVVRGGATIAHPGAALPDLMVPYFAIGAVLVACTVSYLMLRVWRNRLARGLER